MLNQQLISPLITPLQHGQTVEEALLQMEDQGVSHLPLLKDGHLEAVIAESDLLDADQRTLVETLPVYAAPIAVAADNHFLSAAAAMLGRQLSAVPVVASENEYVGTITEHTLLQQLAQLTGAMGAGALVVIEMEPHQLSISELSKLVETNDAHITQFNTSIHPDTGMLLATLRINKQEISDIVATLQRYDYHVVFFSGEEHYENELRRIYQHLMNFLTM